MSTTVNDSQRSLAVSAASSASLASNNSQVFKTPGELLAYAQGDFTHASDAERAAAIIHRCNAIGLDVRTAPFQFIQTGYGDKAKTIMYAAKSCSEQLALREKISIRHIEAPPAMVAALRGREEGEYIIVAVEASTPDGRVAQAVGALPLFKESYVQGGPRGAKQRTDLAGDDLVNAIMKCETKAKRRAILQLCGLGALDESEVETIPNAKQVPQPSMDESLERHLGPEPPVNHNARLGMVAAMAIRSNLERRNKTESDLAKAMVEAGAELEIDAATGEYFPIEEWPNDYRDTIAGFLSAWKQAPQASAGDRRRESRAVATPDQPAYWELKAKKAVQDLLSSVGDRTDPGEFIIRILKNKDAHGRELFVVGDEDPAIAIGAWKRVAKAVQDGLVDVPTGQIIP